jgi:hypothetical protein
MDDMGGMKDTELRIDQFRRGLRENAVPLAILAAGIGCLIVSRTGLPRAVSDCAGYAGGGLRRWLHDARELISDFGDQRETIRRQRKDREIRTGQRRIRSEEPMAGYGA